MIVEGVCNPEMNEASDSWCFTNINNVSNVCWAREIIWSLVMNVKYPDRFQPKTFKFPWNKPNCREGRKKCHLMLLSRLTKTSIYFPFEIAILIEWTREKKTHQKYFIVRLCVLRAISHTLQNCQWEFDRNPSPEKLFAIRILLYKFKNLPESGSSR